MTAPIRLIPLSCPRCATAVPAAPGEVAWVCAVCGQGMLIDEHSGARPLELFCSAAIAQGKTGRPFWVAPGKVAFTQRQTYTGDKRREAEAFWAAPRLFCAAAWSAGLEEVVSLGVGLLKNPPAMTPGSPAAFLPITVLPVDLHALGEFMVLSIEAERSDALKRVDFSLRLEKPQLWVLG